MITAGSGPSASWMVLIPRRVDEIVVDKGRGVDELDPHRQVEDVIRIGATEPCGEDDQSRAEPLAPRLDDVRHRARHGSEVRRDLGIKPALELPELSGDGLEQLLGGDAHDPAATCTTGETGRH